MSKLLPLSVQLYSLRAAAEKDFIRVLKFVAETGYAGVEPAGFWNIKPRELKKIVEDLGMKIFSSHSPWAVPGKLGECMELADAIGLKTIVCGYGPDDFKDLDAIKRTAETTNRMIEVLAPNGYTLFQHNHYWEFERIDGQLKYEYYRALCPQVKYQIDCFWAGALGKEDPVAMYKLFADDSISVHFKDGKIEQGVNVDGSKNGLLDCKVELLALGSGEMPLKALTAALSPSVLAIIVELDYCATDMFEAIAQSYNFMTRNQLAAGRR